MIGPYPSYRQMDLLISWLIDSALRLGISMCIVHAIFWSLLVYSFLHSISLFNLLHPFCWQVKPLIWVEAQVERHSKSRIEIMVKARSQFKERRYKKCLILFYLFPKVRFEGGRWKFYLPISLFLFTNKKLKSYSTATNVEIELPVPADATNPNVRTSMGSASYAPENDALCWKIRSFPGGKVFKNLSASLSVISYAWIAGDRDIGS